MNDDAYELVNLKEHAEIRFKEAELFSNKFGSFSKSDFETLMFTIYLDSLPEGPIYDYIISQQLGITESKVRNLRIKSQLLYPKEIPWEITLSMAIKNGSYNEKDNTMTITIEDPSCHAKIRYEIEAFYGTANLNLNRKQLTVPIESLLSIALSQEPEESKEQILSMWNEEWQRENKDRERITRESLTKRIFKGVGTLVSVVGVPKELAETVGNIMKAIVDKVQEK